MRLLAALLRRTLAPIAVSLLMLTLGSGAWAIMPAHAAPPAPTITATATLSQTIPFTPTATATAPALSVTVNQVEDSKFPLVIAYTSVVDEGGVPVGGLGNGDFAVAEDGIEAGPFTISTTVNSQEPLAVSLLLDISGSMQGKSIDYARQAATSFLDFLGPRDIVELISFSDVAKVNQTFTTTKPIIAVGIQNLRAGGDTALYDAVATAVRRLGQLGPGRKIAVLLTDGEDTSSKTKLSSLLSEIRERRVPVFVVGLGAQVDRAALAEIARQSGGAVITAPSAPDLARAYRSLADHLRSQYVLSFTSGLKADGGMHQLRVRAKQGETRGQGEGVFVAQPLAPWLDIVSPRPAQSITQSVPILVSALPGSPAANIIRIDLAVDGVVIARDNTAPFTDTLSVDRIAPGRHTLRATAIDSAGNSASNEVSFSVLAPPNPEATATPPPEPSPVAIVEETPLETPVVTRSVGLPMPLIAIDLAAIFGAVALSGAVLRRRRRGGPASCPNCGTVFTGRDSCPTCTMGDRRRLLRRLREVVGSDTEDRAGR